MFLSRKGQVSIEIIIILVFVILFISVYTDLANDTVKTIETSKIKNQQQEIILSFKDFLLFQKSDLVTGYGITDINSSYIVPYILIPSAKSNCIIYVNDNNLSIETTYDNSIITTTVNVEIPSTYYATSLTVHCGREVVCGLSLGKLSCSE